MNGWWIATGGGGIASFVIGAVVIVGLCMLGCYVDGYCSDNQASQFAPYTPAECAWKEIERDGDWQQTRDDNQKRIQR